MPKNLSQKLWQKAHKDKVSQYQQTYMKNKTQATVVLESWVMEAIDKVKQPRQTYGNWIRLMIEDWARQQGISERGLKPPAAPPHE